MRVSLSAEGNHVHIGRNYYDEMSKGTEQEKTGAKEIRDQVKHI